MMARLVLCTWPVFVAPAVAAAPLTLADAVARVVDAGPDRAVAAAALPIAAADVRTARMLPNPALVLGAGRSEPIFNAGVSLRLPIFGQRGSHVRAAERGVDEAEASVRAQLWRLRHDARIAYYTAVRALTEVEIARQVETLTARVAAMAAERFDVGAGNRLEKSQAELVHARARQDVLDRQTTARVAALELMRVTGLDGGAPPLVDPLERVGATPELTTLQAALAGHPDLVAIERERQSALARAAAARADRRPTPQLDLGAELLDPSTCNDGGRTCWGPRAGLTFELPVLSLNGGPIARAEAEAKLADWKRAAAYRRIDAALKSAHDQLTAAVARARFYDADYLPTARAVEQMAREGFAAGKTGLLPLIEAERALLDAELGRVDALFAVQAARADLEEASGVALSTP